MATKVRATIDDLFRVAGDGKAELVNGQVVLMLPTGGMPSVAAGAIVVSLHLHAPRTKKACAVGDNAAFRVSYPIADRSARTRPSTPGRDRG